MNAFTFDTHDPFIMVRAYELMCERMAGGRECDTFSFNEFHDQAIEEHIVSKIAGGK